MTISLIAAVAENNVIGKDNDLIWHISEDLKRFKKLTSGNPIIMGRKTYESLPFRPLANRKNIVVSSQIDLVLEGAIVVNSFEAALNECKDDDDVFICGGATIYNYYILLADRIYITRVHHEFEGDTFFPVFSEDEWCIEFQSEVLYDEKSNLNYTFVDYSK